MKLIVGGLPGLRKWQSGVSGNRPGKTTPGGYSMSLTYRPPGSSCRDRDLQLGRQRLE